MHERFQDFAIITLSQSIPSGYEVATLFNNVPLAENQVVYTAGYGATYDSELGKVSSKLRVGKMAFRATTPHYSLNLPHFINGQLCQSDECKKVEHYTSGLRFLGQADAGFTLIQQGDSGGPTFIEAVNSASGETHFYLVGINSSNYIPSGNEVNPELTYPFSTIADARHLASWINPN